MNNCANFVPLWMKFSNISSPTGPQATDPPPHPFLICRSFKLSLRIFLRYWNRNSKILWKVRLVKIFFTRGISILRGEKVIYVYTYNKNRIFWRVFLLFSPICIHKYICLYDLVSAILLENSNSHCCFQFTSTVLK